MRDVRVLLSPRAVACCGRIAELNPYVTVRVSVDRLELDADLSFLKEFQVSLQTPPVGLLHPQRYHHTQSPTHTLLSSLNRDCHCH